MPGRTQKEILIAEMDRQGMLDNDLRAGTAAICGGETGLEPRTEGGYRNTSNARIREIFRAARGMSDEQLDRLKASDADFFEAMYGSHTETGRGLGNTQPGDGFTYIGRCQLQLTGRGNYTRYGTLIGRPDLVDNPELANDAEIGAALTVAYMLDRYHGGGWERMKAAVGHSFGGPDATKNRLHEQYRSTHEFDHRGTADGHARPTLARRSRGAHVTAMQRALIAAGYDCGPRGADGDFGGSTTGAVLRFRADHGLSAEAVCDEAMWRLLGEAP